MENNIIEDKNDSKLLIFDNDDNVYDNKKSLQENFSTFLKLRKDLRKLNMNINNNDQSNISIKKDNFRTNPERMQNLRKKFVEKAISYLGIPYAKKYLTPENPNYNSPIFLDCCGLIRQCVNDLSEEFGFMLGRWNQAYQFDILSEELEFSQLKEGDLIFYEATFYPDKKWKLQPHNMVHVEIFLGGNETPERTIAARERFGVVEYNETYKFTSENYYDIKYHFRSIDQWLKGIHKSFCNEHKWHDELLDKKQNKFSLFDCDAEQEETN